MAIDKMALQLQALGNETRLKVFVQLVRAGPEGLPVGAVQEALCVPGSTLTHHLQKLMAADLADQERRGTVLICRANFQTMRGIIDFLDSECCADIRKTGKTENAA